MPNFKPVVRKDFTSQNGKARIYISVSFKGRRRIIKTDHYVEPEFMLPSGRVKSTHPLATSLNIALGREVIKCDEIFLKYSPKSVTQLMSLLQHGEAGRGDFFKYTEARIAEIKEKGHDSTSNGYASSLSSLKHFTGKSKLSFDEIDSPFLERFKNHLILSGKSVNTAIEYINKIRATVNQAIKDKYVDGKTLPIMKVDIRSHKPPVRLLNITDLRKLLCNPYPRQVQKAVDVWFLSFFLMGLNTKDICFARNEDVHDGRLLYERAKTSVSASIKIPDRAWEIIDKYKGKKYLVSFLEKNDSFSAYKGFIVSLNSRLKVAADIAGVDITLTQNYARRTWATIASSNPLAISLEVIDKAQGRTTGGIINRYVKYDLDRIDEANEKVIKLLFSF